MEVSEWFLPEGLRQRLCSGYYKFIKASVTHTRSSSSGKTIFELTAVENVYFGQCVVFGLLSIAKANPAVQLISNVADFFKAGFWSNEKSVWDEVKENVLTEITAAITIHHKNGLNVDLRHIDETMEDLSLAKTTLTPQNFRAKLLTVRDQLKKLKFDFDPTAFKDSITYDDDPTIIAALTKLSAYYLTVSRVMERESFSSGERAYHREMSNKFWKEVSAAAVRTFYWALNERESYIKGKHIATDEITKVRGDWKKKFMTSTNACIEVELGHYASESKSF